MGSSEVDILIVQAIPYLIVAKEEMHGAKKKQPLQRRVVSVFGCRLKHFHDGGALRNG